MLAASGVTITLAWASAVTLAAWIGLLAALAFATRPRDPGAGPEAMELADQTPAVANFLTHDWKVTRSAAAATLIDLAARRYVSIEQYGPDDTVVRVIQHGASRAPLAAYEQQVFDHVCDLAASAQGGIVPCQALTTGPPAQAARWWRAFARKVRDEARTAGLSRPRFRLAQLGALCLAATIPSGLLSGLLVSLPSDEGIGDKIIGFGFLWLIVFGAMCASIALFRADRETPAGLVAARRWNGVRALLGRDGGFAELPPAAVAIWDRYLAYASAFGVAPVATQSMRLGAESERIAWSSCGGRWREVRISYPREFFGYGKAPSSVFVAGLFWLVAGIAFGAFALPKLLPAAWAVGQTDFGEFGRGSENLRYVFVGPLLGFAAAILLAGVRGIVMCVRALPDLGQRKEVHGQVLRVKRVQKGPTWAAVDDGTSDAIRAWIVTAPPPTDSIVQALISPRLCKVFSLSVVQRPRASAAAVAASALPAATATAGARSLPAFDAATLATASGVPWRQASGPNPDLTTGALPFGTGVWSFEDGADGRLVVMTADDGLVSRALFGVMARGDRDRVTGIGDEAAWIGDSVLIVRDNGRILSVAVTKPSQPEDRRYAVAAAIAKSVLSER